MIEHRCHALGCNVPTKPVPRDLQHAVWAAYRRGQCDDKQPSRAWFYAAKAAIDAVAQAEAARP
jgi:hypothetical protein